MAQAIDISQWQGAINWSAVGAPIAVLKMSGGDAGLYYDSKASINYAQAKASGKAVGMYHFAGGGDPIAEADFFVRACSPLEASDVLVLDWEIQHPDPVGWCTAFISRVIAKTGTIPLIYMNTSTENAYDWARVINLNVGLWVADYRFSPSQNVPIRRWKTYVMHQWTSGGSMAGIAGRVDLDEWFGTVAQFKAYGYKVPAPPPPAPVPPPPPPVPTPPPAPIPPPIPEPPKPDTPLDKENNSLLKQILALLQGLVDKISSIFK